MRRFALWQMRRCERRVTYARQQFDAAWTGLDMNDWEREEARARRRYAFWARVANA